MKTLLQENQTQVVNQTMVANQVGRVKIQFLPQMADKVSPAKIFKTADEAVEAFKAEIAMILVLWEYFWDLMGSFSKTFVRKPGKVGQFFEDRIDPKDFEDINANNYRLYEIMYALRTSKDYRLQLDSDLEKAVADVLNSVRWTIKHRYNFDIFFESVDLGHPDTEFWSKMVRMRYQDRRDQRRFLGDLAVTGKKQENRPKQMRQSVSKDQIRSMAQIPGELKKAPDFEASLAKVLAEGAGKFKIKTTKKEKSSSRKGKNKKR